MSNYVDILNIPTSFWQQMVAFLKRWFREDADAGLLQGEKQDYYRSAEYVRRKRNYFKRKDGGNYANLRGRSVVSNHTSSVNMLLTGEMFEGLHYSRPLLHGAVYAFDEKDKNKILGNLIPFGRRVNTLNQKNRDRFIKALELQLEANIRQIVKDKLVIKIEY